MRSQELIRIEDAIISARGARMARGETNPTMTYTRSMEPLVAFAQAFKLAAAATQHNVIAATAGYARWQMQISKMMTRYRSPFL